MLEPLTNDSIEPYNGSTEEKYGNEKIENFWEELIPTIDQIKPISFGSQEKNLLNFIKQADNSLFLFSEVIISEYLKDEINYLDQRGVRVYLLLKEIDKNHKHYNKQSNILRELGGKCLIRYTSFYPTYFTIILINNKQNNFGIVSNSLITNENIESGQFIINLTSSQYKDFVYLFKYVFWNKSLSEVLTPNDVSLPRKISQNPFDTIKIEFNSLQNVMINLESNTYLDSYIIKKINECKKLDLCLESFLLSDNLKNKIITFLNASEGKNSLFMEYTLFPAKLFNNLDKNTDVFGLNRIPSINILLFDNKEGILLLYEFSTHHDSKNLGIILDQMQLEKVQDYLKTIRNSAKYKYTYSKALEELNETIYQYDSEKNKLLKIDIKNTEPVEIPDINEKNLDDFIKNKTSIPRLIDFKKRFKKRITYYWKRNPPYLPDDAENDMLYNEWKEFRDNFIESVKLIEKDLTMLFTTNKDHVDKFEKWKTINMGIFQELNTYKNEFEDLKSSDLNNLNIEKSKELLTKTKKLANNLMSVEELQLEFRFLIKTKDNHENSINNFNLELKEQEDKIKENNSEIEKEKKLKDDLEKELKKLDEKLQKKKDKDKDKAELQDELKRKEAIFKNKKDVLEKLISKNKVLENEFGKTKTKKVEVDEKLNDVIYQLDNLKLERSETSEKHAFGRLMGIRQGKDDKSKEKQKFIEENKTIKEFDIKSPKEDIPEVGILFSSKKNRFLGIKYYSEYEKAKEIAKNYKCQLVVNNRG